MYTAEQIAKALRDVHFGGNWTCSNLRDQLADVSWVEANTRVHGLNTIVALVYHINYYVSAVLKVLDGGPLDASDKYSFDHPPLNSKEDWEQLLSKAWSEAESLAARIALLSGSMLEADFTDAKYGSYYRNLQGIVEHTHYHLGQIAVVKKIMRQQAPATVAS